MMLACLVLGLVAGGILVIGVAFVSFCQSLLPNDFQAWFVSHSHLIGRLMIPLGTESIVATLAALVASWPPGAPALVADGRSAAGGVMVTYPIFFAGTNEAFVRGGLSDSVLRSLLDRWATRRWFRTGREIVSFIAALRTLQR